MSRLCGSYDACFRGCDPNHSAQRDMICGHHSPSLGRGVRDGDDLQAVFESTANGRTDLQKLWTIDI